MSRIIIPNLELKSAKVLIEKPTLEYKKAVQEADEKISEAKRKEAKAWIHASTYISY